MPPPAPVVSSSRYHEAFRVQRDENEGRVRVWGDGADDPKVDLILGSSPNYQVAHVRSDGDDRVYEVRGLASYDVRADAGAWAEKELVDMPTDALVRLEVTNPTGTFVLVQQDGQWKIEQPARLADQELDSDKVDSLVRSACSLRIDQPVGPVDEAEHGLAEPAVVVELEWTAGPGDLSDDEGVSAAGEELSYRVGSKVKDKDTQRYVTRSGFGFTGTIWESSVTKMIEQDVDDLLASSS